MTPLLKTKPIALLALVVAALVAVGCAGAGSETGAKKAKKVACDFEAPSSPVKVNLLAYNSSAIDPFSNTMVSSCSKDGVTIRHDPIDFPGQVQKTALTLSGKRGTFDILEVYGFAIPFWAEKNKFVPLNDLFEKYKDKYELDGLDPTMIKGLTYKGKLYGLPTQANVMTMVYRKDVFDELGLQPPKTYDELAEAASKIQASGKMQHPLALPAYDNATTLFAQMIAAEGIDYVDRENWRLTFDTPIAKRNLTTLRGLAKYMDPQFTSFDQPKVQQQLYTGKAAIGIMFSGRMADLLNPDNTQHADKFAFAAPPAVTPGGKTASVVSVDGWGIAANSDVDHDLLFQFMAASVSPEASKASLPYAYPARTDVITASNAKYSPAVKAALANGAAPTPLAPWSAEIETKWNPILLSALKGDIPTDVALQRAQTAATKVLGKYESERPAG